MSRKVLGGESTGDKVLQQYNFSRHLALGEYLGVDKPLELLLFLSFKHRKSICLEVED